MRYEFYVNGVRYEGDRIGFFDYGTVKVEYAQEILERYPAGDSATVYYNPENPEECLLEPGTKVQGLIFPGIG